MKAEELMIGDWFEFPMNVNIRINSINKVNEDKVIINYVRWDDGFFLDELKPIPITPEILKNNGFEKGSKWSFKNISIYFMKSDYVNIIILDDYTSIDTYIKYVHELQHLLKICKINKEIIL